MQPTKPLAIGRFSSRPNSFRTVRFSSAATVAFAGVCLMPASLNAQACRTDIPESSSAWSVSGAAATNTETGLEVARCPVGQDWSSTTCTGAPTLLTWPQALQAASAAGNGWRLPNAKELDIVLDRRCMNPSVDTTVFPGATSDRFWSSTPGWVVDQGEGTVIGSQTASSQYAVRLVRAGFSNASFQRPIAASGAVCRADIPGDLNVADWTTGTNVTSGDMMTDTITGLVWQRCALGQTWTGSTCSGAGGTFTWPQALQAARNAGAGWRLPNAKELDAMLDRRCASPAVNPTLFPGAQSLKTWSSTPGWAVDLTDGAVLGSQNAADANSVRLVKSGLSNAGYERRIATAGAVCRADIPGDLDVANWTPGANGTITDEITGLVWARCALGQSWNATSGACTGASGTYTWAQALQEAHSAGTGWRLPNAKELDAMLDRRCAAPAVNPTLFPGAQSIKTWTSTPGWAVDLTDGAVLGSQTAADANSVRLVKAGYSSASFERRIVTAGAVCRTDIPGDLDVANWTPGANGTITDTITGLVWQRCALGQTWSGTTCSGGSGAYTWAQALQAASNAGAGWRLPNAKELDAMLDRRCASPAVNPTLFPGAQNGKAWTSTPGWAVDLTDGAVLGSQTAADANSVRLVSAGYTYGPGNTVTNGACGTADGVAVAIAPTLNLCAAGSVSQFAGTGPWTWTCLGVNGGTPASCAAPLLISTECASSTVSTVQLVNLTDKMIASAAQAFGAGNLRSTFNVTCGNGRFGVVRLPGLISAALGGNAYALVQSSCPSKPVQRMASPAATAATMNDVWGKRNSQVDLLSDTLFGPLARWVCE